MSYEHQNSTDRLEQYRARQTARIEAINLAIEEGRTTVVSSAAPEEVLQFTRSALSNQQNGSPVQSERSIKGLNKS